MATMIPEADEGLRRAQPPGMLSNFPPLVRASESYLKFRFAVLPAAGA